MPHNIVSLLKKSKDTKPQKSLDDSMSEITIVEKPAYDISRQAAQKPQKDFNPADLCFGSCCRN